MKSAFLVGVLSNITLLLALGFLYSVCIRRWDGKTLRGKLILGLLFGSMAVIGMLSPMNYATGVFFDGRTILMGIIGMFGGGTAAFVAVLMTASLRLWQGGDGLSMGLATISSTAGIGVIFYHLRPRFTWLTKLVPLFGFGVLLHIAMLGCIVFLPTPLRGQLFMDLLIPMLVVYPLATMLYGRLIVELEERNQIQEELERKVEERTQDLQAANEELTAMNEEIASLNQNLTGMNDALERRVAERTEDLTATHEELVAQFAELETAQESLLHGSAVQSVLKEIAEAAVLETSLDELYGTVHHLVEKVLPAKNFYIALLEERTGEYVIPYCVDETYTVPQRRQIGYGLADYVMRQRRTVCITPAELAHLRETGEIRIQKVNYSLWAGAPLMDSSGKVFGCFAMFLVGDEVQPLLLEDREVLTIIAAQVSQAIERKRMEVMVRESEERFRQAMEFSEVGLVDIDLGRRTMLLSPQWRERFALCDEEGALQWDTYLSKIHPEDRAKKLLSLTEHLLGNSAMHEAEYRLRLPDGSWTWILSRARALRDGDQNPVRLIGMLSDITELKRRVEQEKYRAEHDELTGLYNKLGFSVSVTELLEQDQRGALVLIDIDDFELINAVHGRVAGDHCLLAFAQYLQESFGKSAVVGRFGGDEFLLFFPNSEGLKSTETAFNLMETICLETKAGTFFVQLSAGASLCARLGDKLDLLLRQADLALNHAKKQGKWRFRVYEPFLQDILVRRQAIREEMSKAFANREFNLVYQPIFDIRTEREIVVGYEALLRWTSPTLGVVSPVEFIPVAEDTNLILPIGKWVLEEACRFSAKYRSVYGRFVNVAVNISMRQLALPSFLGQVIEALHQSGMPASSLNLEITESILMSDVRESVSVLSALRDFGIGISLDDFGTGYSSFTYLAKLPIVTLKIDKSLVDGFAVEANNNSVLLLESLIYMSSLLGYKVVAEGVERQEQLQLLKEKGCAFCQGYLLGKPMAEQEILKNSSAESFMENQGTGTA